MLLYPGGAAMMSMASLTATHSLLTQVRAKFPLGSSNKVAHKQGPSKKLKALANPFVSTHQERTDWANARFPTAARNVVDQVRAGNGMASRSNEIIAAFDKESAGNCYDMAMYALARAVQAEVLPVEQIMLQGGDHSFIALGRFDRVNGAATDLQRWESWGGSAFVCDPWANIACAAADYPQRFDDKMRKWSREGKKVGYWESPVKYSWIDAIDEVGAATRCARASADRVVPSGAVLTVYIYANQVIVERVIGGQLDYEKPPQFDEPTARGGPVSGVPGQLYVCPYVHPERTCRRFQWALQAFSKPLPSLWGGNDFSICADFVRANLYPNAKQASEVPKTADDLERYLGALITGGGAAKTFIA